MNTIEKVRNHYSQMEAVSRTKDAVHARLKETPQNSRKDAIKELEKKLDVKRVAVEAAATRVEVAERANRSFFRKFFDSARLFMSKLWATVKGLFTKAEVKVDKEVYSWYQAEREAVVQRKQQVHFELKGKDPYSREGAIKELEDTLEGKRAKGLKDAEFLLTRPGAETKVLAAKKEVLAQLKEAKPRSSYSKTVLGAGAALLFAGALVAGFAFKPGNALSEITKNLKNK